MTAVLGVTLLQWLHISRNVVQPSAETALPVSPAHAAWEHPGQAFGEGGPAPLRSAVSACEVLAG